MRWLGLFLICTLYIPPAWAQGRLGSRSPAQQAVDDGVTALETQDFAAALQKFSEAIRLDDKLSDAYWRLGALYHYQKRYVDAVEVLRRCPDQNNIYVQEQLALNLYRTAVPPPSEALRLLVTVADRRPEAVAVDLLLGQHYYKSDPARAARALEAYFRFRPPTATDGDSNAHLLLGSAYANEKNWEAAEHEIAPLLAQKPDDRAAQMMMATVLVGQGKCGLALSKLEALRTQASAQPAIYFNLASCYLLHGDVTRARVDAAAFCGARPKDARGHALYGDVVRTAGDAAAAAGAYEESLALDATNEAVELRLARVEIPLGRLVEARTIAERQAKDHPDDVEILATEVEVWVAAGEPESRVAVLVDKLRAHTESTEAQLQAGRALAHWLHDETAIVPLRRALALDPRRKEAMVALAASLSRLGGRALKAGQVEKAGKLVDEAAELRPDVRAFARNAALVKIISGKFEEARVQLEPLAKKEPDAQTLWLLARTLLQEGKSSEAKRAYEAARLAAKPSSDARIQIDAELAAVCVAEDEFDEAIAVAEEAAELVPARLRTLVLRNLGIAYFRRGLERLRNGHAEAGKTALSDFSRAASLPVSLWTARERAALGCAQGLGALQAKLPEQAEAAFAKAAGQGGCALKPPYDHFGAGFLTAYAGYRSPRSVTKREAAARTIAQLLQKVNGPSDWLRQLLSSAYELCAFDHYQRGNDKHAQEMLKQALRAGARKLGRTLLHNQAVLDLARGKAVAAEKLFAELAPTIAEAEVNLGIIRDRQGDGERALELYRKALERGARAPRLKEWIDLKQRLSESRP